MNRLTNMPLPIIIILSSIVLLALGISVYILSYNMSNKIIYSISSIFMIGIISTLITTLSILKEENTKTRFLSTMLISNKNNLPFIITYSGTNNFIERHDELGQISSYLKKDPNYNSNLTSNNSDLCAVTLQYQIIRKILDLNYNNSRVQQHDNKLRLTTRNAIVPTDLIECSENSKEELRKIDRYIASPIKILADSPLLIPKGAEIKIDNSGTNKLITIEKKKFFKTEIIIKALARSQKNTTVYKELLSEYPNIIDYYSIVLEVGINSHFEKLTSENKKTKEYKEWLKYLEEEIESYFSDSSK